MLLDRVDPWLDFLRGDPLHRILLLQIPNYLPVLYVLLVPFGLVPFTLAKALWVVCNLGFAGVSVVIAGRFYGLRNRSVLVALGLFLMGDVRAQHAGQRAAGAAGAAGVVPCAAEPGVDGQASRRRGRQLFQVQLCAAVAAVTCSSKEGCALRCSALWFRRRGL